jgi:hypothetical protein
MPYSLHRSTLSPKTRSAAPSGMRILHESRACCRCFRATGKRPRVATIATMKMLSADRKGAYNPVSRYEVESTGRSAQRLQSLAADLIRKLVPTGGIEIQFNDGSSNDGWR